MFRWKSCWKVSWSRSRADLISEAVTLCHGWWVGQTLQCIDLITFVSKKGTALFALLFFLSFLRDVPRWWSRDEPLRVSLGSTFCLLFKIDPREMKSGLLDSSSSQVFPSFWMHFWVSLWLDILLLPLSEYVNMTKLLYSSLFFLCLHSWKCRNGRK